jgi:hypothetical protein
MAYADRQSRRSNTTRFVLVVVLMFRVAKAKEFGGESLFDNGKGSCARTIG